MLHRILHNRWSMADAMRLKGRPLATSDLPGHVIMGHSDAPPPATERLPVPRYPPTASDWDNFRPLILYL